MFRAFIIAIITTLIVLVILNHKPISATIEILKADEEVMTVNPPVFNPQFLPPKGLSYLGTYQGVLPCADCKGTKVTLELFTDHFQRTVTRLGVVSDSTVVHTGTYLWDESGSKIQLDLPSKSKYQLIDGHLHQLGMSGTECLSFQGLPFILKKIDQ